MSHSQLGGCVNALMANPGGTVSPSRAKAPFTRVTTSTLMFRLDCWVRPGIAGAEFEQLITQCARCGLVMTRRVFGIHECARPAKQPLLEDCPDDNALLFHVDDV